jgi:hypothetical protein
VSAPPPVAAAAATARPRTDLRLALGLAAVLLATMLIGRSGGSLGATTTVEVGLTLIGTAVAAAGVLAAPTPARPWGRITLLALAGLTAWTALSIIWSLVPDVTWLDANRAIAYLAVLAGAIGLARLYPWQAGTIATGVLIATVGLCVSALALKAFPVALNSTEELARLRDPIDYWNALGLLAGMAVPPALWLGARREGPPALRALGYPLLGLAIVTLMLSYSRGAIIAVVAGLACWFLLVPLRLRGLTVLLCAAAGGGAVSVWAFASDALSKDRAPLTQRVSAGDDLALLCTARWRRPGAGAPGWAPWAPAWRACWPSWRSWP